MAARTDRESERLGIDVFVAAGVTAPVRLERLGLAIVRLGPHDVVVCHPSRLGWWNTGDAAGYTTAVPPNPRDMP